MDIHHPTLALAAIIIATAAPVQAEVELDLQESFAPPVPTSLSRAGDSVALNGEFALLGAPADAIRGSDAGAVHVWRKQNGVWAFEQTIRPAGVGTGDAFGTALALSGSVVMIGAPGDDGFGTDAGAVYVFEHGTNGWSQQQIFRGSQVVAGDSFGSAVAMTSDTAVVGARMDDHAGNSCGAAYVMKLGPSLWGEQARLEALNASANDQFGTSVAIHGDLVVVGAPAVNQNGVNSGAAYAFQRTGLTWDLGSQLPDVGTDWFDAFGQSIATDGVRIAVGAPGDDSIAVDAGGAWTFINNGSAWVVEGSYAPALSGGELLGSSIGLSGNTLLVGARGQAFANTEDGTLHAAEWSGIAWLQGDTLGDANAGILDAFGSSLAIDGGNVLVGVPLADNGQVDSGQALLFSVTTEQLGTPLCLGDGTGPDCPCGNFGGPGEGCANSLGAGAMLSVNGQAIVADDTLQFVVTGARDLATGVLIQGGLELGIPFRDGLLCVTFETQRLEVMTLDENGAGASQSIMSIEGAIEPGETALYQYWYRDPLTGPCGTGSNLSGAIKIVWQ